MCTDFSTCIQDLGGTSDSAGLQRPGSPERLVVEAAPAIVNTTAARTLEPHSQQNVDIAVGNAQHTLATVLEPGMPADVAQVSTPSAGSTVQQAFLSPLKTWSGVLIAPA